MMTRNGEEAKGAAQNRCLSNRRLSRAGMSPYGTTPTRLVTFYIEKGGIAGQAMQTELLSWAPELV